MPLFYKNSEFFLFPPSHFSQKRNSYWCSYIQIHFGWAIETSLIHCFSCTVHSSLVLLTLFCTASLPSLMFDHAPWGVHPRQVLLWCQMDNRSNIPLWVHNSLGTVLIDSILTNWPWWLHGQHKTLVHMKYWVKRFGWDKELWKGGTQGGNLWIYRWPVGCRVELLTPPFGALRFISCIPFERGHISGLNWNFRFLVIMITFPIFTVDLSLGNRVNLPQ